MQRNVHQTKKESKPMKRCSLVPGTFAALDLLPVSEPPLNALIECSENIGLPVELRMPHTQTGGAIQALVFCFRSFSVFLKPIKVQPVTELSRVARQACAVRLEGRDCEARAFEFTKSSSSIMTHKNSSSPSNKWRLWSMALIVF